jgi:RNA polymerase-binding transcription factor DksA
MAAKEDMMSPASKATAAKKKVAPSRLPAVKTAGAKKIASTSKKAAPAAKKAAMTKKTAPVPKKAVPAAKKTGPVAKKAAPPAKKVATTRTASAKGSPASKKSVPPKKVAAKQVAVPAKKAAPSAKASKASKATAPAEAPAPRPIKTLGVRPKPPAPVKPKTGPYAKESKFLQEQAELLTIERNIYQGQATSLRAEADSLALEREPGDVQFDEESGEGGTVTVDRERNLALSGQAFLAVEEIDYAMERVLDKTYGYCERCYQPIPKPRLRALPYARMCVACKSGGLSRR